MTDLNILIIGCPGSGKTYLADKMNDDSHRLIHTDDYTKYGYVQSMYEVFNDILKYDGKTIVEGIQGYRLLRHGFRTRKYKPDIVVELIISNDKLKDIYDSKRDYEKLEFVKKLNQSNRKILYNYKSMAGKNLPKWYTIKND